MKLSVDQMHLPQIRLSRINRHPRAVLNGLAGVGITFHPDPGEKTDPLILLLAEAVRAAPTNSDYNAGGFHLSLPNV